MAGTRLRNEAISLRNRQEFQRSQLTELTNTDIEAWVKESYDIATKIYNEVRLCLVSLVLKNNGDYRARSTSQGENHLQRRGRMRMNQGVS